MRRVLKNWEELLSQRSQWKIFRLKWNNNNNNNNDYNKAKIDKTQQKSSRMLSGDRDETINHIKSECNK